MPRGDKTKYTDKQRRQADKIAKGYTDSGIISKEAEKELGQLLMKSLAVVKKVAQEEAEINKAVNPKKAGNI